MLRRRLSVLALSSATVACACTEVVPTDPPAARVESLFVPRTSVLAHAKPGELRALDVDADGDPDIVVGGTSLTLLMNDGGELRAGDTYTELVQAMDFAVADFDEDGRNELAIAEHDAPEPRFVVLRVGAAGELEPMPGSPFVVDATPHLHTLAAIDLDLDGHVDIVTDSWPQSRLVLVRGLGDGRFELPGTQVDIPEVPMQNLASADMNGDGRADIVTPAHDTESVSVLLGDGAGSLRLVAGAPFASFGGFTTLRLADMDGDGDTDVVATHRSDQSTDYKVDALSVLTNDGAGVLSHAAGSPHTGLPDRSNDVAVADFDGDGRADVVVLGETESEVGLLLGGADGLRPVQRQLLDGRMRGITAADLDGDGRAELLVSEFGSGRVHVLELLAE